MPKQARGRAGWQLGVLVVLMLPVIVLLLPFTALWVVLSERLRRCPNCARRGSLHDVTPLIQHDTQDGQHLFRLRRSRIVRTRELVCRHCGARFSETPGEVLIRLPDAQELSTAPVDNS